MFVFLAFCIECRNISCTSAAVARVRGALCHLAYDVCRSVPCVSANTLAHDTMLHSTDHNESEAVPHKPYQAGYY